jgi:BNR repeat-like domain
MKNLVRAVALSVAVSLVSATSALAATTSVITDPFANPTSQHATAVEPDTFAFGSTLVVTAQVGRFFDGGASSTAFATSTDGGATFTSGVLPGLAPTSSDRFDRTTDPVAAYDARDNVWMISSLGLTDPGPLGAAVVVNRSTDGGLTWGSPVTVANAGPGQDFDKNWVACDNTPTSPHYGNCYHTWDDFGDGDRILMSTSSDGGLTWSDPIMTDKRVYGLGGQPVVQADGDVIVPAANAFEKAIIAFRSTDGGESWGDEVIVSHVRDHGVAGDLRSGALPSAEVGSGGRVFTVWSDCRFSKGCKQNSLVMSASDDGVTWSDVRRVPIDDGSEQFIPGIGVRPGTAGQLGLTYYFYADPTCGGKQTDPCELNVGYVQSNDGGTNWSDPQTIAGPFPVEWTADTSQGRMVGDYISTSWIGTQAHGAFAVANEPDGTVFDESIHVPAGGVSAASFPNPAVAEKAFADNGARHANLRSVVHRARRAK